MIWTAQNKDVYNLKSQKTPPNNKLLDLFAADLFKLIKKIRFRRVYNSFKEVKELKISEFVWVRVDKSKTV